MSLIPVFGVRKTARHAKPSSVPPMVAVGGLAAAFLPALSGTAQASPGLASHVVPSGPASAEDFARLRVCESGGDYSIDTGNGYYGAYQFSPGTWRGLGYAGLPNQASPATQDEAAALLQSQRGWQPWPGCSRMLGLGQGGSSTAPSVRASRTAARGAIVVVPATLTPPAFDGRIMTTADITRDLPSVRVWQARMAERGWEIAVDGFFGPQSSGVAQRFAAQKGLSPATPGTVDKVVFEGAWTIPVT